MMPKGPVLASETNIEGAKNKFKVYTDIDVKLKDEDENVDKN